MEGFDVWGWRHRHLQLPQVRFLFFYFLYSTKFYFFTRLRVQTNEWTATTIKSNTWTTNRDSMEGFDIWSWRRLRLQPPQYVYLTTFFFYSTKFIFLLDYLIERANGHLDRHTQVPGQQRTGDSRHICLESLVFFFCYERFGRFFFFLLRFLQSKWFFVASYKYGTTTNGHAHWHLTPHLTPHQHRAVASHGSPSLYHMISCSILVLYSFVKLIISFNFFITQFYKSERYVILS